MPTTVTKYINNNWTVPELASFSSEIMDFEPFITTDGKRLYFGSRRAINNIIPQRSKIWYLTKNNSIWTDLKLIEPPFDSLFVMYVSFSNDKNMFFTGIENGRQYIFESRYINGKYQKPERLSDSINIDGWIAHPYISPNEDYLIFDVKDSDSSKGSTDLFISFKGKDGKWRKAINMGDLINTEIGEMCASVSPDGKYLFFCRYTDMNNGDIYWVKSSIIDKLRADEQ